MPPPPNPESARTALVTGANRGIGERVVSELARAGLRVLLGAREFAAGLEAAARFAQRGLAVEAVQVDVADPGSIESLVADLSRRGVAVDVLVNNAGVYPPGDLLAVSEDVLAESLAVNFEGPLRLCRAFVPAMVERGYGRVVNVSSGSGSFDDGLPGPGSYALAKAALNALTLRVANEVRGDVKVNAVCPGWVRTRMGGDGATRSVEEGAGTVVWLALLDADGPNGAFFRDRTRIPW